MNPSYLGEHILFRLQDPLIVFDGKGEIWYANERFWRFSGYQNELKKKSIIAFLPQKEHERVLGALNQVVQKRTVLEDFQAAFLTKSQKQIPVSFYAAPIANTKKGFATISDMRQLQGLLEGLRRAQENLQGMVQERTKELEAKTHDLENSQKALLNMLEDVQEARRKTEEEKNRTAAIVSGLVDGILLLSNDEIVELLNPAAENLLEIKEKDVAGKSIFDFPANPPLVHFGELVHSLKQGEELFRKELQIPEQKDASLEVTSVALPGVSQSLFIFHDITREKKIERLKTEFVSLSAHQLRTPLSAIKWTLSMFLNEEMGPLTKEQKEFVGKAYQSNERMIDLVNDLLNVTRIEEGRYLYHPEFSQIDELARDVVQLYQEEARRRNIQLIFQSPAEKLKRVLVDKEKIKIVLQNLVENALHYTLEGGKVVMSFAQDSSEVTVSVQDTGIGIPEDQQGQLFERFFRATNAKKIDTEGSGLGLYIAKNIVQAHGGKIFFHSKEGGGTTFTFTIPLKQEIEGFLKKF